MYEGNATILKLDKTVYQPPRNHMLETFFNSYQTLMNSISNKPDMKSDQIEKMIKSLLGMVANEKTRNEIENRFYDDVKDIKAKKTEFKPVLSMDDMDHIYSLAYLRMLGRIWDQKNIYYHIDGNEQSIGIFGMLGDGKNDKKQRVPCNIGKKEQFKEHLEKLRIEHIEQEILGETGDA